jgi:very-short-patch-repair endonuclease
MRSFTAPLKVQRRQAQLGQYARRNRRAPTESEARLWEALRGGRLGVRFRRQVPIGGLYIVDFLAPSARLVVEVDGGYHAHRARSDERRARNLARLGYRVLRLPAALVMRTTAAAVQRVLEAFPPGIAAPPANLRPPFQISLPPPRSTNTSRAGDEMGSKSWTKSYSEIAASFATALVEARFDAAHALLTPELKEELSPEMLRIKLRNMYCRYAEGEPTGIHYDEEFAMDDWYGRRPDEIGLAYVGIHGDSWNEAVTVVVREANGSLAISGLEWGRP